VPQRFTDNSVSLLLAAAMCCLPFILPEHQLPIQSFQAEALAFALGVAAATATQIGARNTLTAFSGPAIWLLAFAALLTGSAVFGAPAYAQLPLAGAMYVAYAALLLWLGAQLAVRFGVERIATVLSVAILAGALANAMAGVIQFSGRPAALEDVVAAMRGNRAYGNVAQANLYVNYLSLGCASLAYLWFRGLLRSSYALAAALLLAGAIALASTRGALLYALWLAALGMVATLIRSDFEARRLKIAACILACLIIAANLAVPQLSNLLHIGPASRGAFERLLTSAPEFAEPRWHIWPLAARAFAAEPLFGTGIGEFAGIAFEDGLPPTVTLHGEIWTSAHNLPLQLLAETGALGAALVLAGLGTWWWRAATRYATAPQPALWWVIAIAGIESIHAMLEFPWWSAHFLGLTALVMGAGLDSRPATNIARHATRFALAGISVALALWLATGIRDYTRLASTRISGTSNALAASTDDIATLQALALGPLAPVAELWMILGASLDNTGLHEKLDRSARVARFWPSNEVIARRVVFLALAGNALEARRLLEQALQSFPLRRDQTVQILSRAVAVDAAAIRPLLDLAARAAPNHNDATAR